MTRVDLENDALNHHVQKGYSFRQMRFLYAKSNNVKVLMIMSQYHGGKGALLVVYYFADIWEVRWWLSTATLWPSQETTKHLCWVSSWPSVTSSQGGTQAHPRGTASLISILSTHLVLKPETRANPVSLVNLAELSIQRQAMRWLTEKVIQSRGW